MRWPCPRSGRSVPTTAAPCPPGGWWSSPCPGSPRGRRPFPLYLYVPALYSEELGLSLAAVGLVFSAIRFADAAWDPAIAILLDRTRTRFGRRRPWVLGATPVLLLALVWVYMPGRVVGDEATATYLFLGLAILYLGQTFYGLAHEAWGAELSTDYHERTRIQAFRDWIGTAGGVAILAIPIAYEVFVDAERMSPRVEAVAWFGLIAIPLTVAANVVLVPERDIAPPARTAFLPALRLLLSNSHLVRLAAIDTLYGLQVGISSGLMVFFVKYWIEVPAGTTAVVLISQLGTLAAIPVWARLSRRIGKHRAVGVAYAVHIVAHLLYPLIGPGDIALYWTLALAGGLGGASASFLLRSITVDIVDYDHWKSGEERTALFFAVLSTTTRIAPSLAIGAVFPLLAALGFDPAVAEPDAEAIQVLRWTYIVVPIVSMTGAAALLYGFPPGPARAGGDPPHDRGARRRRGPARPLGVELDRQGGGAADRGVHPEGDLVRRTRQPRLLQPLQDPGVAREQLEARELRPQAEMEPVAEHRDARGVPLEVEPVRIREDLRVPVGRRESRAGRAARPAPCSPAAPRPLARSA